MKLVTGFNSLAYSIAAASLYRGSGNSFIRGVQVFSIASIFDRAMRSLFLPENSSQKPCSLSMALTHPIVEESIYSGILSTQNRYFSIFRFGTALLTGMTAARALAGPVTEEDNKQGLTLDTKIGFVWAIVRETMTCALPSESFLFLNLADSFVFALSEVCPKKGEAGLDVSAHWFYKVVFSAVFRFVHNEAARTNGIFTAMVSHLLFNFSCYLQTTEREIPILNSAK